MPRSGSPMTTSASPFAAAPWSLVSQWTPCEQLDVGRQHRPQSIDHELLGRLPPRRHPLNASTKATWRVALDRAGAGRAHERYRVLRPDAGSAKKAAGDGAGPAVAAEAGDDDPLAGADPGQDVIDGRAERGRVLRHAEVRDRVCGAARRRPPPGPPAMR